jgi:hypothetical protein
MDKRLDIVYTLLLLVFQLDQTVIEPRNLVYLPLCYCLARISIHSTVEAFMHGDQPERFDCPLRLHILRCRLKQEALLHLG